MLLIKCLFVIYVSTEREFSLIVRNCSEQRIINYKLIMDDLNCVVK